MLDPEIPQNFTLIRKFVEEYKNSHSCSYNISRSIPPTFAGEPQRTLPPGYGLNVYKTKEETFSVSSCGAYGTRTRDPMRDRHVF